MKLKVGNKIKFKPEPNEYSVSHGPYKIVDIDLSKDHGIHNVCVEYFSVYYQKTCFAWCYNYDTLSDLIISGGLICYNENDLILYTKKHKFI
jgi:hypothetical protein